MDKTLTKEKEQTETVSSQSELSPASAPLIQPEKDKFSLEGLRQQYTEVNNHIRHYSVLRFNIFTVFLAALGGLFSLSFGFFEAKNVDPNITMLWGRVGGLLVTLLFFIYERRIQVLINNSLEVGKELEDPLGYKHLSNRPSWGWFRTHTATIIFFLILILFWFVMAIEMLAKVKGEMVNYTELITIMVAVLGTLAAVYNIRLVLKAFKADHERRKKQATIEYVGQILREARFKIDARYRSRGVTTEEISKLMENPEDYAEWRNVLGVFEHLAVGINTGVYDKDILYRMSGSYLTELFTIVEPYVELKRKIHPNAYSEFESLAKEFGEKQRSGYLIASTGNIKHSPV
ncbi:MAG TPA: DUF4760 domain-containing protein [Pyrinomonadaceae bacterium]|jgi:hypothetical protein